MTDYPILPPCIKSLLPANGDLGSPCIDALRGWPRKTLGIENTLRVLDTAASVIHKVTWELA